MGWWWPLLVAPFVGSLLGVLIARLPHGMPVAWARSRCDHCGAALEPRDLVPLLSYAWLQGRCRRCLARIPAFHWQIEIAATAVPLLALAADIEGPGLWAVSVAGWLLIALAWIDVDTMLLPDALTLPLFLTGLLATWWLRPEALVDHLIAAGLAYLLLREVGVIYRRVRHREGLGAGDPKLLGAIGAWVGLVNLPVVLLGSALAGLAWALLMRLRGTQIGMNTALPFGPFLALAAFLVLLAR